MSINHVTCVTITCARCKADSPIYEDMGTAHYESVDQARQQLVTDYAEEPEFQWSIDGDDWFCSGCTAERACQAAGGHAWGEWGGYPGGQWEFRACSRPACNASERRPAVLPVADAGPSNEEER